MIRFLSLFLPVLLIISTVQAQPFNEEQKAELQKMFESYLLENGATVVRSVEKYQTDLEEKQLKEATVKTKEFLENLKKQDDLPMAGNKDGDITIIEFFDYNCGYCRKAFNEIVLVLEKDKNVKIILFDMPILGPNSLEASKWSLAAHKQGKYFEFHKALLLHDGPKDVKAFEKFAKKLDLDIDKLRTEAQSEEILKTLTQNVNQAQSMNISGTPGFIIGNEVFPGYMSSEQMFDLIKKAREKK